MHDVDETCGYHVEVEAEVQQQQHTVSGSAGGAVCIGGAATFVLSRGSSIERVEATPVVMGSLQQGGLTVELGVEIWSRQVSVCQKTKSMYPLDPEHNSTSNSKWLDVLGV